MSPDTEAAVRLLDSLAPEGGKDESYWRSEKGLQEAAIAIVLTSACENLIIRDKSKDVEDGFCLLGAYLVVRQAMEKYFIMTGIFPEASTVELLIGLPES